jgi:hypothetical protein
MGIYSFNQFEDNLILEKRIAQLVSNIEIKFSFDISLTTHSSKRANAEGREVIKNYDMSPVNNAEIKKVIGPFMHEIGEKIINGEIIHDNRFIIVDNKWGVSMVISPEKKANLYWNLVIKTIFRHSEDNKLKVGENQLVLER